MSFWQYCEEVAKGVGVVAIVNHCPIVYACWKAHQPTDDAIIAVNKEDAKNL